MAYNKVTRLDYRRTQSNSKSSLCSKTILVVFTGLCLAGAWVMTSSRKFPVIISSSENSSDEVSSQFGDISTNPLTEDLDQGGDFNKEPKVIFDDSNSDSTDSEDSTSEMTVQKPQDEEEKQSETEKEENSDTETTKVEQPVTEESEEKEQNSNSDSNSNAEVFPDGAQSETLKETETQNGAFSTQAVESKSEKEVQSSNLSQGKMKSYKWKLCDVTAGPDYIPCLDNEKAIKNLKSTKHYEHRERHCPEAGPTCLVSLPEGYKRSIQWPQSRDKVCCHILLFSGRNLVKFGFRLILIQYCSGCELLCIFIIIIVIYFHISRNQPRTSNLKTDTTYFQLKSL
jgi:Putative S-adenosyl-L-methionine-dependent methyltransferase